MGHGSVQACKDEEEDVHGSQSLTAIATASLVNKEELNLRHASIFIIGHA